jgi:hypothetical protein
MTNWRRGLLLGAIQIAAVLSLGGKLLYDRMTYPRVWVQSQVYDPELPIRGRYLSQQLRLKAEGFTYKQPDPKLGNAWYLNRHWAKLQVRDKELVATPQGAGPGEWIILQKAADGSIVALSEKPVLFFISDVAEAPRLKKDEELWVEVTVPAKGPPRPIRIGIKKDGAVTPLNFK